LLPPFYFSLSFFKTQKQVTSRYFPGEKMDEKFVKKAMDFEKAMVSFYLEKGYSASNLLVQKLFLELAKQEIDHLVFILEFPVAGDTVKTMQTGEVEESIKEFFLRWQPVRERQETDNIEALTTAIEMEQAGLTMYREIVQNSAESDRLFFTQLLQQEKQHLESLQNVHFYLTGTGDWFEEEESRRWNWMNT